MVDVVFARFALSALRPIDGWKLHSRGKSRCAPKWPRASGQSVMEVAATANEAHADAGSHSKT
jgi:hypothetical protein